MRNVEFLSYADEGCRKTALTSIDIKVLTDKVRRIHHLLAEVVDLRFANDPILEQSSVGINGEFDSGSERTLAAWIRHASRTRLIVLAITW